MKKIMLTLAAVLCCAMTTTVLTACGGSDDSGDVPGPDKTPVAGVIKAGIKVSEDMLKYLDLTVEYYDANGSVQKETMDKTEWSKEVKAKLTAKLGARLLMKLKDGVDVSNLTNTTFAYSYSYRCAAVTSSNEEVGEALISNPSFSATVTNSEKLSEFINKHKDDGLIRFLFILDGKTITSTSW